MKLEFVKLNPTQNMTLLVTTPVPRKRHVSVAEQLMDYGSVYAEQVGFLEKASLDGARLRLQMMGGEFCGNATMSAGAYLAFQDNLADGASAEYPLEVSGAEGVVRCLIRRKENAYEGTVKMPPPENIREVSFADGFCCPVVVLPGIAHAIVPAAQMNRDEAEKCISQWCAELNQEAFGILLVKNDAIEPLVYVRETDSAVWERGCGSGTAALGAYLAAQKKEDISLKLCQPGGTISVDVRYANGVSGIKITGLVKIAAMGTAWID